MNKTNPEEGGREKGAGVGGGGGGGGDEAEVQEKKTAGKIKEKSEIKKIYIYHWSSQWDSSASFQDD